MLNVFIDKYEHEVPVGKVLELTSLMTAFEVTYGSDFYYPGESHDFWEMVCVLDGEINITADERVMMLHERQLVFHKPMEFHRLWSANKTCPHLIILSFKAAFFFQPKEFIFNVSQEQIALLQKLIALSREVFLFEDICTVAVKPEKKVEFQLFVNMLEQFLLEVFHSSGALHVKNKSQSAQNYALVVNTLHAHLDQQLTLSQIAQLTNMSESNIKRIFEQYANIGVMKYFTLLKIRKAISLLQSGMNVSETAAQLGFQEPCYFSTVFKRVTGFAPREYLRKTAPEEDPVLPAVQEKI